MDCNVTSIVVPQEWASWGWPSINWTWSAGLRIASPTSPPDWRCSSSRSASRSRTSFTCPSPASPERIWRPRPLKPTSKPGTRVRLWSKPSVICVLRYQLSLHLHRCSSFPSLLDGFRTPERALNQPFRLVISDIFKSTGSSSGFCLAGRIESGMIQTGDKLQIMPLNETANVKGRRRLAILSQRPIRGTCHWLNVFDSCRDRHQRFPRPVLLCRRSSRPDGQRARPERHQRRIRPVRSQPAHQSHLPDRGQDRHLQHRHPHH